MTSKERAESAATSEHFLVRIAQVPEAVVIEQQDKDWSVPASVIDRYWGYDFYAAGFATAKDAEEWIETAVGSLAAVLGVDPKQFQVGSAVFIRDTPEGE